MKENAMLVLTALALIFAGVRFLLVEPIRKSIEGLQASINSLSARIVAVEISMAKMGEEILSAHKRIQEVREDYTKKRS